MTGASNCEVSTSPRSPSVKTVDLFFKDGFVAKKRLVVKEQKIYTSQIISIK